MASINWSNVTDFGDMPAQANVASDGTFWVGMLYMLWVIGILIGSFWGFEAAILTASFLALILALLLVYAGLVAWYHAVAIAGVLLFFFLYTVWAGSRKQ